MTSNHDTTLKTWRPAIVIGVILALLIGIPSLLAAIIPARENPVHQGDRGMIASNGTVIKFSPPAGWNEQPTGSDSARLYEHKNSQLYLSLSEGTKDREKAFDRRARELTLSGYSTSDVRNGFTSSSGFTGQRCHIAKKSSKDEGDCAFVEKDGSVVTVLITHPESSDSKDQISADSDLSVIIDSFERTTGREA